MLTSEIALRPEGRTLSYRKDRSRIGREWILPPHADIPAFPPPGPDLVRLATELSGCKALAKLAKKSKSKDVRHLVPGEAAPFLDYLMAVALYENGQEFPVWLDGRKVQVPYVSGTRIGLDMYGPLPRPVVDEEGISRPEVMVIGKAPGQQEAAEGINLVGPASDDFFRALDDLRVAPEEVDGWYVTNVVKHPNPNPKGNGLARDLVRNGTWLLWAEIFLLRPKFILCMGTEAIQAVLGKGENKDKMLLGKHHAGTGPLP
jgi:uracil-DNA glycosylase family 4